MDQLESMSADAFQAWAEQATARNPDLTVALLLTELGLTEPTAERILNKLPNDVSCESPGSLDKDACADVLRVVKDSVREGEHLAQPEPAQLPRKNNDVDNYPKPKDTNYPKAAKRPERFK